MKRFCVLDCVTDLSELGEMGEWDGDVAVWEWQECMEQRLRERFPGVHFFWDDVVPWDILSVDHEERGWRDVDDQTAEEIAEAEREISAEFLQGSDQLWIDAVNEAMAERRAEQGEDAQSNGDEA